MFVYHITHGISKKIIKTNTKSDIFNEIRKAFCQKPTVVLQWYSDEFHDWVDMEDVSELPDRGRLQFHATFVDTFQESPEPSEISTIEDSDFDRTRDSESSWPLAYKIPKLPCHVVNHLEVRQNEAKPVDSNIRREIVNILFTSMKKITMYPQPHQYRGVCSSLIRKYPILRDKSIAPAASPYSSWLMSLRQRFKDCRRFMRDDDYHKEMCLKYGNRKRNHEMDDQTISHCKRPRVIVNTEESEDEFSVRQHIQAMQTEMNKNSPSTDFMKDRMIRTFAYRRKQILGGMGLGDMMENYPGLKCSHLVLSEMERLCGIDILACYKSAIVGQDVKKLVLDCWNHLPSQIVDMIEGEGASWLFGIPVVFKDQLNPFLEVDGNPKTPYPTVMYSKETKTYKVGIDGCFITVGNDSDEAVATVVASYWVFNIQFHAKIRRTMEFMTAYLAKMSSVKISNPVQKIINML